jgi:3-oxoacyl-(acyl-carrier-protein) synthase
METGVLPPQINVIDPEALVAERLVAEGEKRVVRRALSLNLGFGGSAAALVLGAPELLAAN